MVLAAVVLIVVVGAFLLRATPEGKQPGPMLTLAEDPIWGSRALADRTARVRPVVESLTGIRLGRIPEVEATSPERWFESKRRMVAVRGSRGLGTAVLRALMLSETALGICDRERDRIFVFPGKIYETIPPGDAEGVLDLVIAHELAHLVRGTLGAGRESVGPGFEHQVPDVALEEGFAELITARAAAVLGRQSPFDRLRPHRLRAAPKAGKHSPLLDVVAFGRLTGRRFFSEIAARLSVIDMVRLVFVERPPRTVLQIIRPVEGSDLATELQALGREILDSLAGGRGKVTSVWSASGLPPDRPSWTWLDGAGVLVGVQVSFEMASRPLAGRHIQITVLEDDGREPPGAEELVTPGLLWPLRRRVHSLTRAGPMWVAHLDNPEALVPPLVVGTRAGRYRLQVEYNAGEDEVPFLRALARQASAVIRGEDAATAIPARPSGPAHRYPTEIGEILPLLDAEDPSARHYAVQAVGTADELDIERRRGLLAKLTDDPVPAIRRAVWAALIETIPEGPLPLPLLTRGPENRDPYVRRQVAFMLELRGPALEALASIGPPAAPALDELGRLLREGISTTAVCAAFGRIAVPGNRFTGEIVPLLTYGNPFTLLIHG